MHIPTPDVDQLKKRPLLATRFLLATIADYFKEQLRQALHLETYMKGLIKFIKAVDAGKKSVTL